MPDAGASRKRQISGCRSRKPFDDIRTSFRVFQTNPRNPCLGIRVRELRHASRMWRGSGNAVSRIFTRADWRFSSRHRRLRLAFADKAKRQLRSDCSTRWSMPCRSIRCSRPVTKSVLSLNNKGFCNLVIGGVKPGCLQSGLLAQDESFASRSRRCERCRRTELRLEAMTQLQSENSIFGDRFGRAFLWRNGCFGCAIRGRQRATRGENLHTGCSHNDLRAKRD
jgi:hypothetical protein